MPPLSTRCLAIAFRARRAVLGLGVAVLPWAVPAHAAGEHPQHLETIIAITTAAVEIKVTFDDTITANASLASNLKAEAVQWANKHRAEAEQSRKASPELFRNGNAWSFERNYTVVSTIADRYVSVLRHEYFYTGGAHPNTDLNTILWDNALKRRTGIRPFFVETADDGPTMRTMLRLVVAALKAEKKAREIDDSGSIDWYSQLAPSLLKIGAVALAPSTEPGKSAGFVFYYPPYAVGPYAEGSFTVFVPWRELKPFLSSDGASLFGGSPSSAYGKPDL